MKIAEIIATIENFAPISLQEDWDNSGLQIGELDSDVSGVVLTLDVTQAAVDKAKEVGANLIISHHPLLFDGVKTITSSTVIGRLILSAIGANISIYSCHTPLDACKGGINDRIAAMLGLSNIKVLGNLEAQVGIGRVGELAAPMSAEKFAAMLRQKFALPHIRSTASVKSVKKVAICSGSGGSLINIAIESGADCYICGDLKYHNFGDANNTITVMDIGHAESEKCAVDIFMEILTAKSKIIPIFALQDSYVRYF